MADVLIKPDTFCKRFNVLCNHWKDNRESQWGNADVFAFVVGASSEDLRYLRSTSLHMWLFGYEFPDTLIVVTKTEVHILASSKKVSYLQPLAKDCESETGRTLHLHKKAKDFTQELSEIISIIQKSGSTVAHTPKDAHDGVFADAWTEAIQNSGLELVDAGSAISDILSYKDDSEVLNVKKAALLAAKVMKEFVQTKIEGIIDEEKEVKHDKLTDLTVDMISNPIKVGAKLKPENVDIAFPPIFQSGGNYELPAYNTISDDQNLHAGVIIVSLGTRYCSYCAAISRTFLIDPTPQQEKEYTAIVAAQEAAIKALVPGARMSQAYEAAKRSLESSGQTHLVSALMKDVGFGMGLLFRENKNVLGPKSSRTVQQGMVFNVTVGVQGLQNPNAQDSRGKTYAIHVTDTVVVSGGGKGTEVATQQSSKKWSDVSYTLKDGEEEEEEEATERPGRATAMAAAKKLRSEDPNFKSAEQERRQQQEELLRRKNEETYRRLTAQQRGGADDADGVAGGRSLSDVVAYRSTDEMPSTNELRIGVDTKREAVLLPLYGVLVPFHITTIKNVAFNSDNDYASIRITFNFGPSFPPALNFPNLVFLKELSFKCGDNKHGNKITQDIKTLRSRVMQQDKQKKDLASIVKQEAIIRGKRVFRLPDLWLNPNFGGKGRKMTGMLECHANGFRYTNNKNETLDIMFRNIKHAFLQTAQKEMMAILHFHLINPIMVGTKKVRDVQVYKEVMDMTQTIGASKRSAYDPDELEEEQRERERKNMVNREFEVFAKKVQEVWESDFPDLGLEWDTPIRNLGFFGSPNRESSFLMPTVNCVVELTTQPFTVITLKEIEIVNLERVGFNLKNFDMTIVFKDFQKDVMRIDAIPSKSLDMIKEWLNNIEIKYYETKMNLSWKPILKSIRDDPDGFLENGGWGFLDVEKSDSDSESEASDDFVPEGDDSEDDGASTEDSDSDDESVVDSEEDDEGDDEEEEGSGEESEGLDWDELEKKAAQEDRNRNYSDDSEDERAAKKRKGGGGGGAPPKRRR